MKEARALHQLQQGSQQALAWFIDRYNAYVSTIVYNIIGQSMSRPDVEETVSDVFFALWKNADKLRCGQVKAYVGTIARNAAKKKLRERGETLPLEEDVLELPVHGPEEQLEKKEQRRLLRRAVLAMGEPEREIFLRFYWYGQSIRAISGQMELKESTVKSRLSRGREKLRDALMEQETKEG